MSKTICIETNCQSSSHLGLFWTFALNNQHHPFSIFWFFSLSHVTLQFFFYNLYSGHPCWHSQQSRVIKVLIDWGHWYDDTATRCFVTSLKVDLVEGDGRWTVDYIVRIGLPRQIYMSQNLGAPAQSDVSQIPISPFWSAVSERNKVFILWLWLISSTCIPSHLTWKVNILVGPVSVWALACFSLWQRDLCVNNRVLNL